MQHYFGTKGFRQRSAPSSTNASQMSGSRYGAEQLGEEYGRWRQAFTDALLVSATPVTSAPPVLIQGRDAGNTSVLLHSSQLPLCYEVMSRYSTNICAHGLRPQTSCHTRLSNFGEVLWARIRTARQPMAHRGHDGTLPGNLTCRCAVCSRWTRGCISDLDNS